MTMMGPDRMVQCSFCEQYHRVPTFLSTHVSDRTWWTDGHVEETDSTTQPWLIRCERCRGFFRLREAMPIRRHPSAKPSRVVSDEDDDDRAAAEAGAFWASIPSIREPSDEDYRDAIALEVWRTESEERLLRVTAMRRENDHLRPGCRGPSMGPRTEIPAEGNLRRLLDLLDRFDPAQGLLRIEIGRYLAVPVGRSVMDAVPAEWEPWRLTQQMLMMLGDRWPRPVLMPRAGETLRRALQLQEKRDEDERRRIQVVP